MFPEGNPNEMAGVDLGSGVGLSKNFYFIILRDSNDHPQVLKRMNVVRELYKEKSLPVEVVELENKPVFHKIFSSLILADFVTYYLAKDYGTFGKAVTVVEKFKKQVS